MESRFVPRLLVGSRVLPGLVLNGLRRRRPAPRRILVAQHLLLGDTLMLAPLLKKLRRDYRDAEIVLLCPPAWLPLFEGRPYGVLPLTYDPRSLANHRRLLSQGPFDWALVPGDNRWSWIARAMGAAWITAFAGDTPAYKNWPVDEWREWPTQPTAWGDIAATLAPGIEPDPFAVGEWGAPSRPSDFPLLPPGYALLHLGASSPHKLWEPHKWQAVVDWLRQRKMNIILSAGPREKHLVTSVDPAGNCIDWSGRFDLAGLWHLVANARVLVCPDTGVAHLGRLTGTPTVALFGPGSPVISGPGRFWQHSRFTAVAVDIACRDQTALFKRHLAWVQHCWRGVEECGNPRCMQLIEKQAVTQALAAFLDAL